MEMKWFVDLFLGLEKNEDLERSPWRCGLCQLKIGEGICLTPNFGNKKDKKLSNGKLMEACRALVHCSGYNEERRGMMEIGSE